VSTSGGGGAARAATFYVSRRFGTAPSQVFFNRLADNIAGVNIALQSFLAALGNRAQFVVRILRDAEIDFDRFAIFQFRPLAQCRTLSYTDFGATSHIDSLACVDETRQWADVAQNAKRRLVIGVCVGFVVVVEQFRQSFGRCVLVTPATTHSGVTRERVTEPFVLSSTVT
jgi:hypothetical protein